jgi:hypothetical protein
VTTKKDPYPLTFMEEVLDMVASHEFYSFLNGCSNYHKITIASKNLYKIAFIANWGAFVWIVMLFGLKNVALTYQHAMYMAF